MKTNLLKLSSALCALAISLSACTSGDKTTNTTDSVMADSSTVVALKPAGPPPEWGKTIKPEMQAVIEKLASYGDQPLETLDPAAARKNHTPTDAVMDLVKQNEIKVPAPKVDTSGKILYISFQHQ